MYSKTEETRIKIDLVSVAGCIFLSTMIIGGILATYAKEHLDSPIFEKTVNNFIEFQDFCNDLDENVIVSVCLEVVNEVENDDLNETLTTKKTPFMCLNEIVTRGQCDECVCSVGVLIESSSTDICVVSNNDCKIYQ